jgi:transcriptional regulator with XRE-family HTH domain
MKQGKALREFMKQRGLSQAQTAQFLDLSEGMISHYLKGIRLFSVKTGLRISQRTGIPLEQLYR